MNTDDLKYFQHFQATLTQIIDHVLELGSPELAFIVVGTMYNDNRIISAALTANKLQLPQFEAAAFFVTAEAIAIEENTGVWKRLKSKQLRKSIVNHRRLYDFFKPVLSEHIANGNFNSFLEAMVTDIEKFSEQSI